MQAPRYAHKKSCCSPPAASREVPMAGPTGVGLHATHEQHKADDDNTTVNAGTRDPVCGMTVDPHNTPHRHSHDGRPYYFCSAGCLKKFAADPRKYLAPEQAEPSVALAEGAIYTCPMHPQIRQVGPGSCPICGMALEPEVVSAEVGPNPELIDMSRRFWIGLVLTVPVVALEMGGHLTNLICYGGQRLRTGSNSFWQPRLCSGEAGHFSFGDGNRC